MQTEIFKINDAHSNRKIFNLFWPNIFLHEDRFQDTSVALDALSRYATLIHKEQPELNITILSDVETNRIAISKRDHIKMKQINFKNIPAKINVNVDGEGCALVQVNIRFICIFAIDSHSK